MSSEGDFLLVFLHVAPRKRLNAYRKQCEGSGEYVEAQKARRKYEELRAKEEERQRQALGFGLCGLRIAIHQHMGNCMVRQGPQAFHYFLGNWWSLGVIPQIGKLFPFSLNWSPWFELRRLVDQAQQQEMMEVEQAQRAQFLGFSNAWDKYMADYESTAYMSLERLKVRGRGGRGAGASVSDLFGCQGLHLMHVVCSGLRQSEIDCEGAEGTGPA